MPGDKRLPALTCAGCSIDPAPFHPCLEAAAADGHRRAQLALDVYAYRVKTMIGALAVVLGGFDALAFTGGIGENSTWLRAEVCRGLECLGVDLDRDRNVDCCPDADIATADSPARILVIHTREDLMIARESRQIGLRNGDRSSFRFHRQFTVASVARACVPLPPFPVL